LLKITFPTLLFLIGIRDPRHSRHNAKHIVIYGIHTDLGSRRARDRGGGEDQLKDGIVNAREVARAARLVLLGAERERVHVDARVGGTRVVLEGLDNVKVGTLTLREAVLAVELEFGRDARVLTPAVHIEGRLGEHERARIGESGRGDFAVRRVKRRVRHAVGRPLTTHSAGGSNIDGTGHLEETGSVDESGRTLELRRSTERMDSVGERVESVRVVEGLGTQRAVKDLARIQRRAVVDVGIGLDDPDELLARVVEVQLDLVGGRADGLVTRELELLEEVLVGVLGHLAALVRVEEDIVDVEGRGHQGLLVGRRDGDHTRGSREGVDRPQALTDGAEIEVDLDLVVLEGDQRERQAGVAAVPEEQGDVERRLRERVAGSAHLGRATGRRAGAVDVGERGVRDVGKLGRVTNHLEVATLLLGRERELVPDVHPVTVLAVNALTTNLHLNLRNNLLADEIQPTRIDTRGTGGHGLVDLRESHLKVRAVAQITVTGDRACDTATEIRLTREGLLDGLHREVCVASV